MTHSFSTVVCLCFYLCAITQLKNLDFEELQMRLTALDPMMEREIEELRQRYTAKRQPILDAMDAKKRRQQNFWVLLPVVFSLWSRFPKATITTKLMSHWLRGTKMTSFLFFVGSPLLFWSTLKWPLNEVRCFFYWVTSILAPGIYTCLPCFTLSLDIVLPC